MAGIANDLAYALDPVLFAQSVGYNSDPWQGEVLRSTAKRVLLNCCRQSGKSTTMGVLAVHTAVYVPDSLVLLLSPALRQSQELFRKALDVYHAAGGPVPADAETALRLELQNGSRIVSLPGKETTIRGYSGVRLLVVDEASRVPDELYFSIRPMLAVSGGRLLAPSTPFGKRGWWYEACTEGIGWERYEISASQCPRISPEFLAEERRVLGPWWFRQEYECQFSDTTDQIFSHELVIGAVSSTVKPLFANGE